MACESGVVLPTVTAAPATPPPTTTNETGPFPAPSPERAELVSGREGGVGKERGVIGVRGVRVRGGVETELVVVREREVVVVGVVRVREREW